MKDLRLKIIVFSTLLFFAACLRLLPFRRVLSLLPERTRCLLKLNQELLVRYTASISARIKLFDNCLIRCCAYYFLSSLSQRPVKLILGAKKKESFGAHSWVSNEDDLILLGDTPDFNDYSQLGCVRSCCYA